MSKIGLSIVFVIAIIICIVSLSLGGADVGYKDIINLMLGNDIDDMKRTIIFEIRLPRVVMAFLIGMLLASSGVVVQSVFLNPLADPYIIGIAASATFGAIIAYLLKLPDIYYGIFGFIASAILSLVIFKLSKRGKSVVTLLIIGIAFSSFLSAFTSFATYLIGEDSFKIVAWMMGFIGGANWDKVAILIIPLVISMVYFYIKRFELNVILSGDEEAQSLGVDVEKTKKYLLIVSSLAVSFSVAFTGMIGFVGLIIPHTLRMLLKTSNNVILIPISTIVGGIFLLACDLVSKSILAPIEVPIGVITAFFGAPFFLYLAIRSTKGIV
ncbi:iron ABC transporter permease [Campylobacter sp. faydin G-140]|uniref:FecCD family ABC transporter permease n=1 Tax=Campylobacter anatolicus TaxID=2829105 RepID=UPI001BA2E037|nr:iron ABC transporter permease [Campylobacter anatolicus]MBR8461253.1 iron ABC transporter permease [Campylobacter anatolicus]MBR8466455.1 iron ABC transporter permease [Campylobacter anatolicus]